MPPLAVGAGSIRTITGFDPGLLLALVALVLLSTGAVGMVILRRRSGDVIALPTTRADPASADTVSGTGSLNDPLLEAMESSARERGRRGAISRPADAPTPIAAWVKRLDAEMNVLADLADVPASPLPRGRRPRPADDRTLSA